jgi:hypothetical protein
MVDYSSPILQSSDDDIECLFEGGDSPIRNEVEIPRGGAMKSSPLASKSADLKWLPWVLSICAVYIVALPWISFAIILDYLVLHRWRLTLPGLESTELLKVTMALHMAAGAVIMIFYPLQLIPWLRMHYISVHRWNGTACFTVTLLCVAAGLVFIAAKGKLVGGWNMTAAFAAAGMSMAACAIMSWRFARLRQFTRHRNWAIRAFSQIISPFLYRFWYNAVGLLGYRLPEPYEHGEGEVCREDDDVCTAYLRPFDALHCWTYWLFSLAIAECILFVLRKEEEEKEHTLISDPRKIKISIRSTTGYGAFSETVEPINNKPCRPFFITERCFFIGGVVSAIATLAIAAGSFTM